MPGLNWCQLINFWCHLINIWGHVLLTTCVLATWTKSGLMQCLLGEDVLATLKWVATVFCQTCSRWNLELGSGWLHCLRTLPVCSQLGNLVALPTYTACISCGLATWQLESGCLACLHCLLGAPRWGGWGAGGRKWLFSRLAFLPFAPIRKWATTWLPWAAVRRWVMEMTIMPIVEKYTYWFFFAT